METYLFQGIVLPERAQISLHVSFSFLHHASGTESVAKISIWFNQVVLWVETELEWDIFDLRNVVKGILQTHLAMVGYLKGYAYDFDVIRVLNRSREIDHVFGIEIPCLEERAKLANLDLDNAMNELFQKASGPNGVFLNRCFSDLASAMKHASDTGFYCYRAVESLLQHCAAVHGLSNAKKKQQWKRFRELSQTTEATLLTLKEAADPLRHGKPVEVTSDERAKLFTMTWEVVDAYLKVIQPLF